MATDGLTLISHSPAATERLGQILGSRLQGGDCVGLIGELGAGKTAFARGIGVGLGVQSPLRSPSYLLCCEHAGRLRLLHLDAYFDQRLSALLEEGLAARFGRDAVVVVEWADRLASWWPQDRLEVSLEPAEMGAESRRLSARATGPRSAQVLAAWAAAIAGAGPPE